MLHHCFFFFQIDFQPITGKAWRQNMRYQHSAGIRPRDISVRRTQRLHVEYIDQPIPVYWVDKGFVYTQEGVDDYDHRVGITIFPVQSKKQQLLT